MSSVLAMTPIKGRNDNYLYRAHIPKNWTEIQENNDLKNSINPIKKYQIENVSITVHNFIVLPNTLKVTPLDQISRWINQGINNEKISYTVTNRSRGGFVGHLLEINGESHAILALAMELDQEQRHILLNNSSEKKHEIASDFTIKASGPKCEIKKFKNEIFDFMNSFELIEELDP